MQPRLKGVASERKILCLGAAPIAMAAGDWNGDGATTFSSAGSIRVLFGRPGARFEPGPVFALAGLATVIAAADVNGDSRPDIIANLGPSVVVLLARGDGAF